MWSERIRAMGNRTGGDEPTCTPLRNQTIAAGSGLGAFQNFVVVQVRRPSRKKSLVPALAERIF
jgi:hypothetical protein